MIKQFLTSVFAFSLVSGVCAFAEEEQENAVVFEQEVQQEEPAESEETSFSEEIQEEINLSLDDTEDDDDDDDPETDEYLDLKRLA